MAVAGHGQIVSSHIPQGSLLVIIQFKGSQSEGIQNGAKLRF